MKNRKKKKRKQGSSDQSKIRHLAAIVPANVDDFERAHALLDKSENISKPFQAGTPRNKQTVSFA